MSLTVAVQMDPLERINISGDSTFAVMLSAQARGHKLYHYLADALTWQDGRLYAGAHPVTVQAVPGEHFRLGEFEILDLGRDVDVVLMWWRRANWTQQWFPKSRLCLQNLQRRCG